MGGGAPCPARLLGGIHGRPKLDSSFVSSRSLVAVVVAAVACAPVTCRADAPYDRWKYSATVYLWAAGIQGETPRGAEVDVGYAFGQGEVSLLYRYASWDFGSGEPMDNISFSGPLLAGTWRF